MSYQDVIDYWFTVLTPKQWWVKDEALDNQIKEKFLKTHQKAASGGLSAWRSEPMGRLAEIIVLDQFSRNIFRGLPESFAFDEMALVLAREAVEVGCNKLLEPRYKQFLYLPFMHSESVDVHEEAIKLFSEPGLEHNLDFEYQHKKIIDQFGRYPHRNEILGRESTAEELSFLQQPGSSF
ncbi:MAG: DUF924 domain-containing protein [Gammaproteobacteria bacterium]|nr:DUF924 domain-containing protein [Gammaproteobacteria bacterium]MCH9743583.1 DUF924 domain-containing protein [Gammaproteobacteria bacterium]